MRLLGVADEPERLVGQVLGQVIALLGPVRLLDVVVVLDERRIPLVGLAADEPVEAVEPARQRPVALAAAHRPLVDGDVVVLADPERVPALLAHHLGQGRVLHRDVPGVAGEALGALGDLREAVLVVVAAGQEAGAGRRAQRRGVPLAVRQAVRRQAIHGRHLDPAAVRRPGREARVVVEHDQHVRRALRRRLGQVGPQSATESRTSRLITPLNGFGTALGSSLGSADDGRRPGDPASPARGDPRPGRARAGERHARSRRDRPLPRPLQRPDAGAARRARRRARPAAPVSRDRGRAGVAAAADRVGARRRRAPAPHGVRRPPARTASTTSARPRPGGGSCGWTPSRPAPSAPPQQAEAHPPADP